MVLMLKFIYNIYFVKFENVVLDSFYKRICVRLINIIIPVYYFLTRRVTKKRRLRKNIRAKVIVSLTSYPARIKKVWLAIETLLDQSQKPDLIILWLYKEEFTGEQELPKILRKLEKRGIEIRYCDKNLMPHKKYYYVMRKFPESIVITVDDDMLFHPRLIDNLFKCHKKYPNAICCSISREIQIEDDILMPYKQWKPLHKSTEPTFKNHIMGGGGTLFPVNSLHPEVFNKQSIEQIALRADDLWLKVMSLKNRTKVASVAGEYTRHFIPIIYKDDNPLMDENLSKNKNDKVIKDILKYYNLPDQIFSNYEVLVKHSVRNNE